jgi:excisionase family DNA binding protein
VSAPANAKLDPESVAAIAAALATMAPVEGGLLDADGAGRLLGVPATWLRKEARNDRVPHVRLGRYVRFDRDDLLAWAAARSRGPKPRTGSGPVSKGGDSR